MDPGSATPKSGRTGCSMRESPEMRGQPLGRRSMTTTQPRIFLMTARFGKIQRGGGGEENFSYAAESFAVISSNIESAVAPP